MEFISLLVTSSSNQKDDNLLVRGFGTKGTIVIRHLSRILADDSAVHERILLETIGLQNSIADAEDDEKKWQDECKTPNGKKQKRVEARPNCKPRRQCHLIFEDDSKVVPRLFALER